MALLYDMIEAVASQVFIPLTVGGGVNAVEDIRALLNAGADKVSINTSGVQNPDLIGEASARYGAQCIVCAIDAKKFAVDAWQVYIHGGRTPTGIDAVEWAEEVVGARRGRNPADEHGPRRRAHGLRPAADARGRRRRRRAGDRVRRRGLASDLVDGVREGGADAVLAASIFHYGEFTVGAGEGRDGRRRDRMSERDRPMRLWAGFSLTRRPRAFPNDMTGSTTYAGTPTDSSRRSRRTRRRTRC